MLNRLLLILLCAFPFSLSAQPIRITLTEATMNEPGNRAVLVSNQYGVLRYYKPLSKKDAKNEAFSFEANQRLGERLSLTLVREVDGGGIFGFENTTYCNLANGALIDAPAEEGGETAYESVEFSISGVRGAEEVIVLSPVEEGAEYRIDRQRLLLNFRALASADIFVLFKLNGSEDYLYYYGPGGKANRIDLDIADLKSGVVTRDIALPSMHFWYGDIKGYQSGSDKPCYLYNSSQLKALRPQNSIRVYLPPGLEWKHFDLELFNLGTDKFGFYNRYLNKLPDSLGAVGFNPLLADHQSKAFRFQTTAEEIGQFYAISYTYSLANQMPASWQVYGLVEKAGEVDFILPDLPEDLLEALPELRILPEPAAITKSLFRCARCEDYDFRLEPAKLQQENWRLEKGLVERAQFLEF